MSIRVQFGIGKDGVQGRQNWTETSGPWERQGINQVKPANS